MAQLQPYGLNAVPAVINTLSGTDLTDPTSWRDAWEVAVFLQDDLTLKCVLVPMRGDFSEEPKEVSFNSKLIKNLIQWWSDVSADESRYQKLVDKYEKAKEVAEG
jgi:hypothetical protein